jgi:FkbM family methyltransferase
MTFEEAQNNVKIGHFTRKCGEIRGVIHVGANDGEEIEGYFGLGAEYVLAFEPLDFARESLLKRWGHDPRVLVLPFGLADRNCTRVLDVTPGDGKGSSFLKELQTHYGSGYEIVDRQWGQLRRFDSLPFDGRLFNTLVVDVQGMELEVLKGFGFHIYCFAFLNIECSRVPLYEGEAPAQDIIDFLSTRRGFQQDSPIEDHNDIMFVNRRLNWPILF